MSQSSEGTAPGAQDMSALLDGELDATAVDLVCAHWRESEEARADWHAYLLIGDVLRSDDLARRAEHDSAFLAGLRKHLAQEPVVLAPAPLKAAESASSTAVAPRRRHWRSSLAVAAGFAAVAGVLVVTQMPPLGGRDALVAGDAAPVAGALATVGTTASPVAAAQADRVVEPLDDVLSDKLVRDARLDDYLAAHKRFGGSSAPGGPSGFMRNAAAEGR